MTGFSAPATACGIWAVTVYQAWTAYGPSVGVAVLSMAAVLIAIATFHRKFTAAWSGIRSRF